MLMLIQFGAINVQDVKFLSALESCVGNVICLVQFRILIHEELQR